MLDRVYTLPFVISPLWGWVLLMVDHQSSILPFISDVYAYSTDDDGHDLDHAVDEDGTLHVGGGELTVVVADIWFVDEFTEIDVGTSEAHVEDAGEGCLGVSAVGTCVSVSVFCYESYAASQVAAGCYHKQGSDACGQVVGHIVDACCNAAELPVAFGAVAYHGVEGVDHLVCHHAWHTEHGEPEEWRYDAVAEVLGQGLESCGADLLRRELTCVAPNDAGHLLAPFVERTIDDLLLL